MRISIILSVLLFLFGCGREKSPMSEYGFRTIEQVSFHPIKSDFLFKPTAIEVFDSLFLVHDPVEENTYTLFSINSPDVLISGGKKGTGPEDVLYGQFTDKINEKEFQVIDMSNGKVLVYNVDSILKTHSFIPVRSFFYNELVTQKAKGLQYCYYLEDSTYIGLGVSNQGKYYCIGKDTVTYWGNYPEDVTMSGSPFYLFQGVLQINADRNLLLYHSPTGYYYELYARSGDVWKQRFVEYMPVEHVEDAVTENTPCGVSSADLDNDFVYLLFSGRTLKEYPEETFLASHIFILTTKGEKVKCLETDRLNVFMCVERKQKRIYAISRNPDTGEYEVGYYPFTI